MQKKTQKKIDKFNDTVSMTKNGHRIEGTYIKTKISQEMELYVRQKGTDNGNEVISVTLDKDCVGRLVDMNHTRPARIDNAQKDICYGLKNNEHCLSLWKQKFGDTVVDLDSFTLKQLSVLRRSLGIKKDTYRQEVGDVRGQRTKISKYLFAWDLDEPMFNLMPTRAGKVGKGENSRDRHPVTHVYHITEIDKNTGKKIYKTLNHDEFKEFNKQHIVKTSSPSMRFAQKSAYVWAVNENLIVDNNKPDYRVSTVRLNNLRELRGVRFDTEDEEN